MAWRLQNFVLKFYAVKQEQNFKVWNLR